MHIARQTPRELVVVSGTRWLSAIVGAAAVGSLYFVVPRREVMGYVVTAFLALFAVIMDLRKTFTFDAMQRVVHWKGRTILKAEAGEVPFDAILDICRQSQPAKNNEPVYRLAIVTAQATVPMAYTYNGQPDAYSTLRTEILSYVRNGTTAKQTDA